MTPRTGRPTTNPKKHRLEVRLSEEENKKLSTCAEKLNTTKTNVIIKGIDLVEAELKEK